MSKNWYQLHSRANAQSSAAVNPPQKGPISGTDVPKSLLSRSNKETTQATFRDDLENARANVSARAFNVAERALAELEARLEDDELRRAMSAKDLITIAQHASARGDALSVQRDTVKTRDLNIVAPKDV